MKSLVLLLLATSALAADPKTGVNQVIDSWHQAASKADETGYFALLTEDAVFFGTDPKERWPKKEFRDWAHPIFAKGKGWTITGKNRNIFFSGDRKTAWFDETADSKEMGPCRGTGVLKLEGGKWRVAQYNLSTPIPNEKFDEVRKLIEAPAKKP